MFRSSLCTVIAASIFSLLPWSSDAAATAVTWEELVSPELHKLEQRAGELQRTFTTLPADERKIYQAVAHELSVKERLANGSATEGELSIADLEILERSPSAGNPEALAFWQEVAALNSEMKTQDAAVDPALQGKDVRIPGYVLPLEFDGTKVREFLLVPYVGACIHTPPPPANQMVYVKVPDGFESEGLYAPVWVEGTMETSGGEYSVSFIDGNRPVAASYSLQATKVEKYEQ